MSLTLGLPPRLPLKFLPRSLLWRTFLLIALLMVLSVTAWAAIFTHTERDSRAQEMAQMVVSVVNLTRTAIITADPLKRRELLLELSYREGIRIYPADENEIVAPLPDRPLLKMIADDVRKQLGEKTRLTTQRKVEDENKPEAQFKTLSGFWVSFQIEDDEYWVMLPGERLERVKTWQWLGWGFAALALALLGAYLIMFRVTRPLNALTIAARNIGLGKIPPPIEESGPGEIRTVTHAFNQMSQNLVSLDADRALILAGISHDLRTPLARLRLSAEMSGADESMLDGMVADIEEMDKVIGQFLDFARDMAGEPPESVELNAIIIDAVEQFHRNGSNVKTHLAPLPKLILQPMAMRRLVANLIGNALRYGGADNPVDVETYLKNHQVILEVKDRGPGIPSEETERLKQPFTKLEYARTGPSGAGLGLAIVDRVVRNHAGTLDLLPREEGGLVARITLPLKKAT